MQKHSVQSQLLIPSAVALTLLFVLFAALLLISQKNNIQESSEKTLQVYKKEFQRSFASQANAMLSLQEVISSTAGAKAALRARNRAKLNEIFSLIYEKLRDSQGITHFYFHSPERVNIIRLHDVDRYGDTIDRRTALAAAQSKQSSYGFELGILGTFTLRVVTPVYADTELIGFLELGKEIEDIASDIAQTYNLGWAVLIDKAFLSESDWTQGMAVLGRSAKWNQFNSAVLSSSSYDEFPPQWREQIHTIRNSHHELIALNNRIRIGVLPLENMDSNRIGSLLIFIDESELLATHQRRDYYLLASLIALLLLLLFVIKRVLFKADLQILDNQEQLRFQAHHDALTGIANRKFLYDRLSHALHLAERQQTQLAVLFIDLDHFKSVNDRLGHDTGDELLCCITSKMQRIVRKGDTLARNSGDEFVVLLENITNENDSAVVAQKITDMFSQPFELTNQVVDVTASIGISLYPRDGKSINELMVNADSAMYQAKATGKNRFYFYNRELATASLRKLQLEQGLRSALKNDTFSLAFQPQVNLRSGDISGVEALLRWHDPELGTVSPVEFIPLAENTGIIHPLGNWVLLSACEHAKRWLDQDLDFGKIAVNVSGKQLQNNNLVEAVSNALETTGLQAQYLEVEVTESVLMTNLESSIVQLNSLREMGVNISIDDFGTGYSSLSQLKALPIQTLKIDRSFISDLPDDESDAVITRTIIAMASSLALDVIAEGVETAEQASFLKQNNCFNIQGYFFSKPLTSHELEELFLESVKL